MNQEDFDWLIDSDSEVLNHWMIATGVGENHYRIGVDSEEDDWLMIGTDFDDDDDNHLRIEGDFDWLVKGALV